MYKKRLQFEIELPEFDLSRELLLITKITKL